MPSATLSCRCRHCGRTTSYERSHAGLQIQCPSCGKTLLLPGELLHLAPIQKERRASLGGVAMEVGGIILLAFFPWGTITGIILLTLGWRRSFVPVCGNCGSKLASTELKRCPGCHATLSTAS